MHFLFFTGVRWVSCPCSICLFVIYSSVFGSLQPFGELSFFFRRSFSLYVVCFSRAEWLWGWTFFVPKCHLSFLRPLSLCLLSLCAECGSGRSSKRGNLDDCQQNIRSAAPQPTIPIQKVTVQSIVLSKKLRKSRHSPPIVHTVTGYDKHLTTSFLNNKSVRPSQFYRKHQKVLAFNV